MRAKVGDRVWLDLDGHLVVGRVVEVAIDNWEGRPSARIRVGTVEVVRPVVKLARVHGDAGGASCEDEDGCDHCGASDARVVNLGAHGEAVLCATCENAVLYGGPCPLGVDCPEDHAA